MADEDHTHVYNQCACGAMWLPIDGAPPPHSGGSAAASAGGGGGGGGGGGMFGKKDAAVSRSVARARVKKTDRRAAAKVAESKERVAKAKEEQKATIVEFRKDAQDVSALLARAGSDMDAVQAVQEKFNEINHKLAEEAKRVEAKTKKLKNLQKKLREAKKNQSKIFCGMALWKACSAVTCVLLIGVIVMAVLQFVGV